jgi:hypothetical protein
MAKVLRAGKGQLGCRASHFRNSQFRNTLAAGSLTLADGTIVIHRALYGVGARSVQAFLEGLGGRKPRRAEGVRKR